MRDNQKLIGMLGLAMRAGKVIIGTEQVCISLSKKKIPLVLVSAGASDGTKKKICCKCEFYAIPLIEIDIDTDELGRLLGKTYTPAVIGISDVNFAKVISDLAAPN